MNELDRNELNVLKWAAGAPVDVSQITRVEEEKLLALLWPHRLYQRLAVRVEEGKPRWYSRKLGIGVWAQCRRAKTNLERQCAALREINAALAPSDPPLMIKGFSTYALTGESRHIHFSSDLDLFDSDPESLWQELERLGYTGEKTFVWSHEFGTLSRRDVTVEVHKNFPVWSYPPGIATRPPIPAENPGYWLQPFDAHSHRKICYEDLRENACSAVTPETSGLLVPNPTLAVLILCAHLLRDYMEPPHHRPLPIRLGELADLHDLSRHALFDRERFLSLTERFAGSEAVDFASYFLRAYLGVDPLPRLPSQPMTPVSGVETLVPFPRSLIAEGCWACLNSAEDLLLPLSTGTVVEKLEANPIIATVGNPPQLYTFRPEEPDNREDQAKPLERVLVQSARGNHLSFDLSVTWREEDLHFELLLRIPLEFDYVVYLHSSEFGLEHTSSIRDRGTRFGCIGMGDATLALTEKGCLLSLSVPWKTMPASFQKEEMNLMMLYLLRREWLRAPIYLGADPIVVVPLKIVKATEDQASLPESVSREEAQEVSPGN